MSDYSEEESNEVSKDRGRRGERKQNNERDDKRDDKPTVQKENYIPPEPSNEEKDVFSGGISTGINFDKYDRIDIKVTGENVPLACQSFESCGLRTLTVENIKKCGYHKPTPVQKQAISIVCAGRDLMACAQTGSGKTAAFLIPIIDYLIGGGIDDGDDEVSDGVEGGFGDTGYCARPQAVVVSPTRELTLQIYHEARKFSHNSRVKACVAYGGTTVHLQAKRLLGCNVLVATPGRLNHFVKNGWVSFSKIKFFVLDEADRMLDMGFLPAVEQMLEHPTMVPVGKRQTLMFSATFPNEIQRLAGRYLNNYLFLVVGIVGGACTDVEQTIYEVGKFQKREKLIQLLNESGGRELTLVFVETKRNADFLAAYLSEQEFPTTSIHGDRLQSQRELALADFKSGRMPTLVATAVAARGLDIKNVGHVVNYDMPSTIDEYVHRIGRTGRVGNRGKATSFYDSLQDQAIAGDLVKILQQAEQEVPPFLMNDVSSGFTRVNSSYPDNNNSDVRKGFGSNGYGFSLGNGQNQPEVLEEEEEW